MKSALLAAALPVMCSALPGPRVDDDWKEKPCDGSYCLLPPHNFSSIAPVKPRIQWQDAGGYCGSVSIQATVMAKGAWLSEQQVRNHSTPGGGHDNEILETNIEGALTSLRIRFEGFDYKNLPTPQANAYRDWLKAQLVEGHALAWMIMLGSEDAPPAYPVYPSLPYGDYSHVEPVFGILSGKPLRDASGAPTPWDDSDYIVFGTNVNEQAYYKQFDVLPDDLKFDGNCKQSNFPGDPCVYEKYGFAWAMVDLDDSAASENRTSIPVSLLVDRSMEPDTRRHQRPARMTGTLTATGATAGAQYEVRLSAADVPFEYSPHCSLTDPRSLSRATAALALALASCRYGAGTQWSSLLTTPTRALTKYTRGRSPRETARTPGLTPRQSCPTALLTTAQSSLPRSHGEHPPCSAVARDRVLLVL